MIDVADNDRWEVDILEYKKYKHDPFPIFVILAYIYYSDTFKTDETIGCQDMKFPREYLYTCQIKHH